MDQVIPALEKQCVRKRGFELQLLATQLVAEWLTFCNRPSSGTDDANPIGCLCNHINHVT